MEMQERKIDNRLVIEVKGKKVVISEILLQLENKLSKNSNIEEVRFFSPDIVHIDKDFKNEVWHGKNLVILTKTIEVHDKVTWNVSGKDNNHNYSSNAGTGEDGHGKQGADGYAGESGGNVLILAEKIENPKNFTIISNGGKGSKGQDGGCGKVGKDGKGIEKDEFDKKFPPVASLMSKRISNISTVIRSIHDDLSEVRELWYTGTNKTISGIIDDINGIYESIEEAGNIADEVAPSYDAVFMDFKENVFIKTKTSRGNEITFSFERGGFTTNCQAFLLYTGSLGQPGGHGGEYGLGGEGGYPGEIVVKNSKSKQEFPIIRNAQQGNEGEKGQGGLYGNHGKNGWDMGYMDYSVSGFFTSTWPKYFGTDKNSKCTLTYYDYNSSDRIWCPYKRYKRGPEYAKITTSMIEHKQQRKYEERKTTRQNSDRQRQAKANRKKNILQSSILATYSHDLDSTERSTVQELRSVVENTEQRASQEVIENQEQQEKQATMVLGIKRHVNNVPQGKNKRRNDAIPSVTYKYATNVDNLIDKLKGEPQLLDNWLQLKGVELPHSVFEELFGNFEKVKKSLFEKRNSQNDTDISELQDIEKLLIDKYKIATLQEIAKQLPPYQEVTDNIVLTPESAARYLVEEKEKDNISHPILGSLNQYFYENGEEQREKISKFCKEELQNTDNEALKFSIKTYVLEVGKSEETHTSVKKYYSEYREFSQKQEDDLNIEEEEYTSELEEGIQKDNFPNVLYNWDKCCKDQEILKEYNDYIRKEGPLSASYRELLAYIFGINIRLYGEDQDNELFLLDNHNLSSKQITYVSYRDNKFIQLSIDRDYLRLEEECKKKDNIYTQVLVKIDSFTQKQGFDDYLKNISSLLDDKGDKQHFFYSDSKDKQYFNEEDIKKIIEYFPGQEKQQLKARLGKLTSQYIGQQGILHNLSKRFSSEGKHVSYQELCCLINSILTSSIEDRKEQNTFCWIVAAHSQRNWIDELILLQLENRFKRQLKEKSKWREYLSKIENKDVLLLFSVKLDQGGSISTECVEDTLHLLSNISNETISLEGLELSEWPYALKEKYWLCKLLPLTNWQESEKLPTASYYLLSIENTFGTDLVEKLLEALGDKKQELSPDALTNILSNFHNEKWNLTKEELKTICNSEWTHKATADGKDRDIMQLVKLIKGNDNTSKRISDNLSKIEESVRSICNEKYSIAGKSIGSFTEDDIKNWTKEFHDNIDKKKQDIETCKEMLAVIDRAIELKRGFKLRDTQRLVVLALLTNSRSTLAQVSTGEGKSLIVVAVSIMKAHFGEQVDIVTSSSVLAKRDAEDNKDIYSLFDIDVSHNCSEDITTRKEAYSSKQVVYGDLSNFQRDYLLDRFYGKNILGDRKFENVIIDEVDSMLLDKGNNMLYLSHDLAGLDKLESVYIYVWQWINRPARDHNELSYAFNTTAIKEAILNDLYGLIKKEDIGKLDSKLSRQQENVIWERLIKAEILDGEGKLLRGSVDGITLDKVLSPEFISYKDRLDFLFKECIEREKFIYVPNYLRAFVEQHLESWINSAINAFFMKERQDYVIDVDRTGTSPDREPNITILDRDTGTDQANSQWGEALHQFLQLKHGCKLSLQSLKAVFVSNVSFFKLYNNLYGLTGTLGSKLERDLLKKEHGVDFVTIPTAKSKQFHEDTPILCTSKDEWINHIRNEVQKLTKERSVLIICETVHDVETLRKAFEEKDVKHVHTYIRDYEEFDIAQGNKKLGQGQIVIATNLAGRGTDIKITEELREAGGLHVCVTYLPSNIRIEQQAFGRAARSGDKGSGQLIIMGTNLQGYRNSKIWTLKNERDAEELHRISDIKTYYETQITMEESCFKGFKEQYEQLKRKLDDKRVPTEVKEILLQSCLDKWAFWLDENSKCIKNLTNEQSKRNFNSLLDKFILEFKNLDTGCIEKRSTRCNEPETIIIEYDSKSWLAWVEGNPFQMVKLGRYLSQNKEHRNAHRNAVELFDEVIKKEPYFSEAAHYYKAFVLAKKIDWEQRPLGEENKQTLKEFKKELRKAARLLDEHSRFAIIAAGIIGKIKKNNDKSIRQVDAYEEQKKSIADLYYMFLRSIDDIFGHTISPQSFVNYAINEELAEVLYEDLLREGILKKPKVRKNISEEVLETISSDYGVSVETLKGFLSQYKGKEINEKEFQKALKEAVPLPSREAFWKSLIKQEILNKEVKYVVADREKLKEVDPSLLDFLDEKIKKGELEKQTLQSGNEEIFFNVKRIEQQKNNDNFIFKKDDFKAIGPLVLGKYQILKKKGVLSFNRKAHIDKSKIGSASLPHHDSITLEDFTKVNITKNEAERILAELVQQKIIEKKKNTENSSENSSYGLKIKSDAIVQIQLPSCPIYEDAVEGLLSACFTYRIAIQEIIRQLEEKKFPISLQLMIKPYQSLVLELLEQRVIKPVTVTTVNFNEKLCSIYSLPMTKDNCIHMLLQNKPAPEGFDAAELFDHLVEKGWIYNPILQLASSIENAGKFLAQGLYYISNSDKEKMPLNSSYKDMAETILDRRLQLAKEDTIKNITRTLERSRSALKALKVPDMKLKPLTELCGQGNFSNIEEVRVFFLNGLDQLLQLEEAKWTWEMLLNTAAVVAIGVSQIVIGTVIELYSVGVMTHVGAAFVNEGLNDISFAVNALTSGYFSWNDYGEHKLKSLMSTATTFAIGAYLSSGAKASRFGHKLAGPNFKVGERVAEMSGNQLIAIAGWQVVGKEVVKDIVLKAIQGVVFSLANAGVDTFVQNCLRELCEGIASNILLDIEKEVEKHKDLSKGLEEAYKTLGEEKTREMVNDLTQSVFTEQNYVTKLLPVANTILSSVSQGIAEAVKKRSTTSNELVLPIHAISTVIVWSKRIDHIANIVTITGELLDDLDRKVEKKCNSNELKKNAGRNKKQEAEKDYKSFEKEIIDQWKSLLREKAGQVIAQHIVTPILTENANHLVRYVGRKIGEAYQTYKENRYREDFEKRREEYHEELQNANKQQHDNTSQTEKHITEKYHEDLLKLMKKTRSPDLFADIVKENVPMDMLCVDACTQVIHRVLRKKGIKKEITVNVKGEGGIRQEFSSMSESAEKTIISLELKDNHFQFCGSNPAENSRNGESTNNCLYEALSEAIPGLRDIITPEELRAEAANSIQCDKRLRHHIEQSWHTLPLSLKAFGGASSRSKSDVVPDPESTSCENEMFYDHEDYQHRERKVSSHITGRLMRFLRLGGMTQRVSEQENINRDKVVESGASRFQDRRSNRGRHVHAAHMVRVGAINLKTKNEKQDNLNYQEFKNFVGHTQNVPKYANVSYNIGGDIDSFQSENLEKILTIDFSKGLTEKDASTINSLKENFIALIDNRINTGGLSDSQIFELKEAKESLAAATPIQLFKKGKDGYMGQINRSYRRRR
ncbi:uncharacterized protein LOC143362324 [Halictus rubicundus]|uniref:uncharacterized protein LOC143362324 n=1 Tax=Halictus rubicundus TaxID=77578 RepID=UPI00403601EB